MLFRSLAASTGGTSPAFARWLRERLDAFLDDDVVALGDLLAGLRIEVRARDEECAAVCDRTQPPPPLLCATCPNRIPAERWQDAIDDEVLALLHRGASALAHERIRVALGIDRPLVPAQEASR